MGNSIDSAFAARVLAAIRLQAHGKVRLDRLAWSRFGALLRAHGVSYDEARQIAYRP